VAELARKYKEAEEVYNRATRGSILVQTDPLYQGGVIPSVERPDRPVQPAIQLRTQAQTQAYPQVQTLPSQPLYQQHHYQDTRDDPSSRNLQRLSLNPNREQSTSGQRFPVTTPRVLPREAPAVSLPPVQPYDAGRAITTLMKIYDEKSKYHGSADILDTKIMVFYDLCSKAGVREND
jgi:hypothetical protein